MWHRKYPWLVALGAMFAVSLFLYTGPLTGRTVFAGPDNLAPSALGAGLRDLHQETGELPLWQPWLFAGMPTLHSFTYTSSLYLPGKIFRPLRVAGLPLVWILVFHLIFGGLGTWLLIRKLGGSNAAATMGGLGFMLMPYTHAMLVHGHGSQMMTLAYLPWAIWALINLYDRPSYPAAGVLALLTGLHLQRGHAQISYYILLLAGLTFVALLLRGRQDSERSAGDQVRFTVLSVTALLVGFAMATSLFLPAMSYTPFSIRGGQTGGGTGFEYATQWSFSFGETSTWLLPSFYGFGGPTYWGNMPFTDYPNYMGLLLLALALWAVWRYRTWWSWTFAAGGGLAYLLSLGNHFFLYRIFYDVLPYFNKFRVPSMLLVLTQFSVVVLAGLGLDNLLAALASLKKDQWRRQLFIAGGVTAGLALVFFIAAGLLAGSFPVRPGMPAAIVSQIDGLRVGMIRSDALWLLGVGGGALLLLALWRQEVLSRQWMLAGLLAVSVVDLARIDRQIINPDGRSLRRSVQQPTAMLERYLTPDPVTEFLSSRPQPFRVLPLGSLQNDNRLAAFGLSSLTGYHPAKMARYDRLMKVTGFRSAGILQMLNVRYLVSLERFDDPRFTEAFVGNLLVSNRHVAAVVYEFTAAMPRAWFPRKVSAASAEGILQALLNQGYDPAIEVYVESGPDEILPQTGAGTVPQGEWGPSHIRLQVRAERAGLLAISEMYYPKGWVARIDGETAPIVALNTVLRGVVLPAGDHELTLDFEPADVKLGMLLGRLALVLVLASFVPAILLRVRLRK